LKQRINWTLEKEVVELLKKFAQELKLNGHRVSVSRAVEILVMKSLSDPVARYKKEAKELQLRLISVTDRITELEEAKNG